VRPKTANQQCLNATLKALDRDEMLPEAHGMMAILRASEFDWKESEREFRRALELGPESSFVLWTYSGYYLLPMRRLNEAIAACRKALELDPLSPLLQWNLGHRYWFARQWDQSIQQFRNTIELDPQWHWAYLMLGFGLIYSGKPDEGIDACETTLQIPGGRSAMTLGMTGGAYALVGQISKARKFLGELLELSEKIYVPPMAIAWIYGALGEAESAFDWMEKAVDERDGLVAFLADNALFDPVRSHPRYQALLRKMNLEAVKEE
jgi:tetratricopeptide (TPR) repeat protein